MVFLVFVSHDSGALWLYFLGVANDYELSALLTSVSTFSVVVGLGTSEGRVIEIIEVSPSLVLSFLVRTQSVMVQQMLCWWVGSIDRGFTEIGYVPESRVIFKSFR